MEGKKLSKKSKNLNNVVLTGAENIEKVKQNGKVNMKTSPMDRVKLSIAPNNKGNKNKKAAKLLEMIQGPGAAENIRNVQKAKEFQKTNTDTVEPIESKIKKEKKSPNQGTNGDGNTGAELDQVKPKPKTELGDVDRKKIKKNKKEKKSPKQGNGGDGNTGAELEQIKPKPNSELDDVARKKIEKKKAKKAAQKLKKAQRKEMLKPGAPEGVNKTETTPVINVKKKPNKALKNVAKNTINNGDGQKEVIIQKTEEDTSALFAKSTPTTVSDRVLNKKIRKEQKRQNVKAQKLAEKSIRSPAEEEATVFVGNLPVNTKRVQLVRLFEKCGPVNFIRIRSAAGKVLLKHKNRKAAGSLNAYVVLQNKSAAEKALQLNGVDFKGNHLRITKSSKKTNEQRDDEEVKRTVFVGNLRYSATEEDLRQIFSSCGEIEFVRCIRDGDKGCKGVAYVCFRHADDVGLALELKGTILEERPIHVERYSVAKLGAKEQRDAQAVKEKKAQLQKPKKGEKVARTSNNKKNSKEGDALKKSKKSEFRGVKVDGLKKKNKNKNKKNQKSQFSELARKIAPKVNN